MSAVKEDIVEVFQSDQDGQFYWHRTHPNGAIVSIGGEGYTNKQDAWDIATEVNATREGHTLTVRYRA